MSAGIRTTEGEKATEVILSVFRANGLLLAAGDLLAAGHGLTSARWQVLGAIAMAQRPLTVPQIARRMGLTRQSVHTTVNRLVADGMVELTANADHRRSQLARLTELGRAKHQAISLRQAAWVSQLAAGLTSAELEGAERVLGELCARLEAAASKHTTPKHATPRLTTPKHATRKETTMNAEPVVLINAFEVPEGQDEAFLQAWERAREFLATQEGYVSTRLHRSLSPAADFRFVNVAVWQSAQAFQAAISQPGFRDAPVPFAPHASLYEVVRED